MNWLAKISLNTVVTRLGVFRSTILLLVLIITCLFCGYRLGNYFHGYQVQTIEKQSHRLEILYHQQVENVKRINTLEVELEVERIAKQNSHALLKQMESEHYQVKKDLAFYEKVMAPEKEADGLVIDDISVFPTESPHHYRFQVTLVQQRLKKQYAKGNIQIVFSGSMNNKPIKIPLSKVSTLVKKDLSFSFKYFQVIDGEFTLPDMFVPENLTLSAVLPKSKWQKYHQTNESYSWRSIIKLAK